jgi:hypothetical protein
VTLCPCCTGKIGWFLRHCFHCFKGSDRQALDLVDRDA